MHIVFYDDQCPLCLRSVAIARKADRKKVCRFYPLESEEAAAHLSPRLRKANTLVLLEDEKRTWIYGKAVLRLLWLLGGKWAFAGWLYILPKWIVDPIYRFVAKHRSCHS